MATNIPLDQPAEDALVLAFRPCGWLRGHTPTDASGTYEFAEHSPPPFDTNKWALLLEPPPDGIATAPVSSEFVVTCGSCEEGTRSTTSSSESAERNIACKAPYVEEAPRSNCSVPRTVNALNGNMYLDQTDARVSGAAANGLTFVRSYNSANVDAGVVPGRYGVFGPGWLHSYEKRLAFAPYPDGDRVLVLREADGTAHYFQDNEEPSGNGEYLASVPSTADSKITKQMDGTYWRLFRNGGREEYEDLVLGGQGRLTAIVDAAGLRTTLTYVAGRLETISDPGGRQLKITYDGGSQPSELHLHTPGVGDTLIATYTHVSGKLKTVTYADGDGDGQSDGGFTFNYDPSAGGRMTSVVDGAGKTIETHEYDAAGRALIAEISGGIERYTIDYSNPLKTIVTDALGNRTDYEYTTIWGRRALSRAAGPCSSCGTGNETQEWTYYDKGWVKTHKNGAGDLTTYTYDTATGDLLTETREPGGGLPAHVTTYTYYTSGPYLGRLHTRTDPNGAVTTYEYDPPGPRLIRTDIDATHVRETEITYNALGKPRLITDPNDRVWELSWLPIGDLEWIKDPLARATNFQHDLFGRRTRVLPPATSPPTPNPEEPTLLYDTLGRTKKISNPNGSYTRFVHDGGGRLLFVYDASTPPRATQYQYDDHGRLKSITDAMGGLTEFIYDTMSNLKLLKDAVVPPRQTEFQYVANRLSAIIYPGNRMEQFSYDRAGRLRERTDRKGVTTTYTYDGLGRLLTKSYSDGTPTVTLTYDVYDATCTHGDQKGTLTAAATAATPTTPATALTWCHDLAGQVRRATATDSIATRTLSYTYDDAGNRLTLTLDSEASFSYAWDPRGLLDTMSAPGGVYDFEHDQAWRRASLRFPTGILTDYDYDNRSRLSLVTSSGGTPVQTLTEFTYPSYDNLDNRLARSGASGLAEEYTYDDLYRLSEVKRSSVVHEAYSYDRVGNRLTALNWTGNWTYSDRNELTATGTPAGGQALTFLYDLNGNMTQKVDGGVTWTYEWDGENRLKKVRKNGADVVTYAYDALGRRARRTLPAVPIQDTMVHDYIYDGEDVIREGYSRPFIEGPITEIDRHIYVHGPGIDEPLAVEHGTREVWYALADGLGSIVKVVTGAAATIASRQYDAFGNLQVGAGFEGYAFTGREWDPETGLYYYRARYYDPRIGRFISEDPIKWAGGINLYTYVLNNPVNGIDPLGLQFWPPGVPPGGWGSGGPFTPPHQPPQQWRFTGVPDNCLDAFSFMAVTARRVQKGWIPDKIGHCQAHCEIVKRCGSIGRVSSFFVGYGKECYDDVKCYWNRRSAWDDSDINANKWGASCPANQSCEERCKSAQTTFP